MVQIKWTRQGIGDLKGIAEYISKDSVQYAKLQVLRIKSRIKILKSHKKIGRKVPEFERLEIRELIEGNYRIIYKIVSPSQIDILTVHHSARDLSRREIKFRKVK
jgi:addiction module RelE/StbE family toxin